MNKNENIYVIGIDMGGTKIEACLIDGKRTPLARERVAAEADQGREQVVKNIVDLVEKIAGDKSYAALGIGTPGTYLEVDDCLYGAPHTPVYEEPGLIGLLRSRFEVPVLVENDANCLALAEFYASCVGKYSHVLAVILGTGVGSGLVLNNRLHRGANGNAGEIGHTSIHLNGRLCECGRRGCAEAYLSGPSLSRRYYELSGQKKSVREIFKLYREGEQRAVHLFEDSCRIMAELFANAVNFLDLQAVILGGGVSNLPIWYERIPSLIQKYLFGIPDRQIPLIKAGLGDSAGVFGAAYLALRHLGIMDF